MNFYKVLINGLNIKEGGSGGKHSQETKDKISQRSNYSESTRIRLKKP